MSQYWSTSADTLGARAYAAARPWMAGLARILAAPFVAVLREMRIQRTANMLQELDDRTLADIGLRRTQIMSTATQIIDWPYFDPRRNSR